MIIPVRNLYYIFVYAWARFPGGSVVDAGIDQCPTLLDLFAHLLVREVQTLLRRGLAHDYQSLEDELAAPRGKIELHETMRLQHQLRNRVTCRFDEFTSNIACNQIVKASAFALIRSAQVTAAHRDALRGVIARLARIDDVRLDAELFKRAQPIGSLRRYRFILSLCQLLFRAELPDQNGTSTRFADILESQALMGKVFEAFLRNFYSHEQASYRVGAEIMAWEAESANAASAALLPEMQTDITLRSSERILVVEAKYYTDALAAHFGGGTTPFSSPVSAIHLSGTCRRSQEHSTRRWSFDLSCRSAPRLGGVPPARSRPASRDAGPHSTLARDCSPASRVPQWFQDGRRRTGWQFCGPKCLRRCGKPNRCSPRSARAALTLMVG